MPENNTATRRGLRSPAVAAIVSAALTASLVGGVAIAQTSAPAVITACVTESTGSVRIVGAAGDCRTNERLTTWNQQGPQGEPGPRGPAAVVNVFSNFAPAGECRLRAEYLVECAPVTVHVPPNQTYVAVINSAGVARFTDSGYVGICPSARPVGQSLDSPSCWSLLNEIYGGYTDQQAIAANGAATLTGGPGGTDWIVSTGATTFDPSKVDLQVNTIVTVSEGQVTFGG